MPFCFSKEDCADIYAIDYKLIMQSENLLLRDIVINRHAAVDGGVRTNQKPGASRLPTSYTNQLMN